MKPSKRLAYILGVLCSDGFISKQNNNKNNRIVLSVKDKTFARKFHKLCQLEFKLEGSLIFTRLSNKNHANIYTSAFYSKEKVLELTDGGKYGFHGPNWHLTIENKYPWILGDNYFYNFLNGFFDGDGSIDCPDACYRLRLHIGYIKPALWLQKQLKLRGFNFKESYRYDRGDEKVMKELSLAQIENIVKFSKKIKSSIHRKEIRLIRYRKAKRVGPKYSHNIEEVFNLVKEVRKETEFGARRLAKHPDLIKYNIPYTTIRGWIHRDTPPLNQKFNSKNNKIYWEI